MLRKPMGAWIIPCAFYQPINTTIMKSKYYLTVREIRDYADKLKEQGVTAPALADKVCDFVFENTHPNFEIGNVYLWDDYDRIYVPDINDDGYPYLQAYNSQTHERMEKDDLEIPVTRGFSDTPERKDTDFTTNDVACACEMERDKHTKVYPWMLKQIAPASDFGIEDAEYEELLENVCGM